MNELATAKEPLATAVLFLIFNRPDTTARVFDAIRRVKPRRLYIAADGARDWKEGEIDRVESARAIATSIDWPCELRTLFRDDNLGCKGAVSDAITWFFKHEEQGIILEDDCLPHVDFFRFATTMLNRYKEDDRVSVVTGNNFLNSVPHRQSSYYFSKYSHCWGWASWRRAWQYYDGDLSFWPEWSESPDWKRRMSNPMERRYWEKIFGRVRSGKFDTWDYPWMASIWYHNGLTVTPNVNLVSNIGFGPNSTHTTQSDSPLAAIPTEGLGEIRHPRVVETDAEADRYVFEHVIGGKNERSFVLRVLRKLWRNLIRIVGLVKEGRSG